MRTASTYRIAARLAVIFAIAGSARGADAPAGKPSTDGGKAPLTNLEKARKVVETRKEAEAILAKYRATGFKEVDLLERYAALHRANTELAPDTCPRCWAEYGEALSYLGYHFWYLEQEAREAPSKAAGPGDRKKKTEAEAKELRARWQECFARSNEAYERHFREARQVHPYSYERVMRHCELLGDFRGALRYLEEGVKAYGSFFEGGMDEKTRGRFDRLRALYRRELEKAGKAGKVEGEGKAGAFVPRSPLFPETSSRYNRWTVEP